VSAVNWNCDGSGPHTAGEVRVLPTGGDSNAILCRSCFDREIAYRRERNRELSKDCAFKLPTWDSLKVYGETLEEQQERERCETWRKANLEIVWSHSPCP